MSKKFITLQLMVDGRTLYRNYQAEEVFHIDWNPIVSDMAETLENSDDDIWTQKPETERTSIAETPLIVEPIIVDDVTVMDTDTTFMETPLNVTIESPTTLPEAQQTTDEQPNS